jgi:hypothetical protein
MSNEIPPPPLGPAWNIWAEKLNSYLQRTRDKLRQLTVNEKASDDGILMWDRSGPYPVVSLDGEWRQLVIANGYAFLFRSTSQTAAASDTGYPIVFDTPPTGFASGIYLGDSPNQSRVYFEEGGLYYLSFTAQISSTNSSLQTFYFWPRINGTDVFEGTTRASLASNGATQPVTKSAVFRISANDYLEAVWATSDHTRGSLSAFSATAFAPATPSVSLSITRISA